MTIFKPLCLIILTTLHVEEVYQRLLETLPNDIEKLEISIKHLEKELEDVNLYLDNPQKYNHITSQLINDKKKLDELLNQWLEIQN